MGRSYRLPFKYYLVFFEFLICISVGVELAPGKVRQIQHMVHTSFWSADGKPISSVEYLQQLFGDYPTFFTSEAALREIWSKPDTRKKLLDGLDEKGYSLEGLEELKRLVNAEKSDLYDVLAYIAFEQNPETRQVRVDSRKDLIFSHYSDKQQGFLDFILSQYIQEGVGELGEEKLPGLIDVKYGTPQDAVAELGQVGEIREMFLGFQKYLYEPVGAAG